MKTKFAIIGSLALAGAGIWYLFFKKRTFNASSDRDPVGPIQKEESGLEHIRQIFHKAKESIPEAI